jgi:hypothetical protein
MRLALLISSQATFLRLFVNSGGFVLHLHEAAPNDSDIIGNVSPLWSHRSDSWQGINHLNIRLSP